MGVEWSIQSRGSRWEKTLRAEIYSVSILAKGEVREWTAEVTNRCHMEHRADEEVLVGAVAAEKAGTGIARVECIAAELEELAIAN